MAFFIGANQEFQRVVAPAGLLGQLELAVDGAELAGRQVKGLQDIVLGIPNTGGDGAASREDIQRGVRILTRNRLKVDGLAGVVDGAVGVAVDGKLPGRGGRRPPAQQHRGK